MSKILAIFFWKYFERFVDKKNNNATLASGSTYAVKAPVEGQLMFIRKH